MTGRVPREDRHGTVTNYVYGCRCDPCKTVYATYQRDRRQARKGQS